MGETKNPGNPQLLEVIKTVITRGNGTGENPKRWVTQYHSLDGEFLAEFDSWEWTQKQRGG